MRPIRTIGTRMMGSLFRCLMFELGRAQGLVITRFGGTKIRTRIRRMDTEKRKIAPGIGEVGYILV